MLSKWMQPKPSDTAKQVNFKLQLSGILLGVIIVVMMSVLSQVFQSANVFFASIIMLLSLLLIRLEYLIGRTLKEGCFEEKKD